MVPVPFGGLEGLELADATAGEVGARLYLRWRASLAAPDSSGPRRLMARHVFADGRERIGDRDLLCPGFSELPSTVFGQRGRVACPLGQ